MIRKSFYASVVLCAFAMALPLAASQAMPGEPAEPGVDRAIYASLLADERPAQPAEAPALALRDPPPHWFFGFLEFDWDPQAPGGVPGFSPWPSDSANAR